jgi:hypothetical protein
MLLKEMKIIVPINTLLCSINEMLGAFSKQFHTFLKDENLLSSFGV